MRFPATAALDAAGPSGLRSRRGVWWARATRCDVEASELWSGQRGCRRACQYWWRAQPVPGVRGLGQIPTVVLEAGFPGNTANWRDVQPTSVGRPGPVPTIAPGWATARRSPGCTTRRTRSTICSGSSTLPTSNRPTCWWVTPTAGCSCGCSRVSTPTRRPASCWSTRAGATRRDDSSPSGPSRRSPRVLATPVQDGVDLAASEALASRVRSLGDDAARGDHRRQTRPRVGPVVAPAPCAGI